MLTIKLQKAVNENAMILEKAIAKDMEHESLKVKVERLKERTGYGFGWLCNMPLIEEE